MTHTEKRNRVAILLRDAPSLSDRAIGKRAGVDGKTVAVSFEMSNKQEHPERYNLEPEACKALGTISPELAWLQIKTLVSQAVELDYDQAEAIAKELQLPIDLADLVEDLEEWQPARAINEFHYSNPKFNLKDVYQNSALKVLEAVVRMLVVNDRIN